LAPSALPNKYHSLKSEDKHAYKNKALSNLAVQTIEVNCVIVIIELLQFSITGSI
jgi:hypothetical protein